MTRFNIKALNYNYNKKVVSKIISGPTDDDEVEVFFPSVLPRLKLFRWIQPAHLCPWKTLIISRRSHWTCVFTSERWSCGRRDGSGGTLSLKKQNTFEKFVGRVLGADLDERRCRSGRLKFGRSVFHFCAVLVEFVLLGFVLELRRFRFRLFGGGLWFCCFRGRGLLGRRHLRCRGGNLYRGRDLHGPRGCRQGRSNEY